MQTSSGFNINLGVVIDKNLKTSALQSIEKLRAEAEKKGSISLKVKMDTNGVKQQIETITTASGDYAKVISVLDKNNKILKQSIVEVGNSATKASKQIEKAEEIKRKEAEKSAQILQRAQEKEDRIRQQQAEKAEREAKRQAEAEQKALARATAQAQKEADKQVKALEKQALAEKKAEEEARKLALRQRQLAEETKRNNSIIKNFTDTFLKMVKFNTINLIYDGIIDSMRQCITVTEDFNKAMTEFKKVTDTSNLSLSEYVDELTKLGEVTAKTTTEMLQASTEFSKSGYSPEDSAKLAQVATLYQNIADAELTAGESASFIISQMKAFDIEANNAISIIDKVNEVKLLLTSINCVNFWKAKTYYMSC